MKEAVPARPRFLLWMKLAALGAFGVVLMHAVHLTLGNRIASRALSGEQLVLGRSLARLVARQAADPLLLSDPLALHEIVEGVTADADRGIAYCFIQREGRVIASSFPEGVPEPLLGLRPAGGSEPLMVRSGGGTYLDLVEPVLDGRVGEVRLGLDMSALQVTRRRLAVDLGLLALLVVALGVLAAFLIGQRIARPIGEMLEVTDRFDPAGAGEAPQVQPHGTDEVAVLAGRFNRMLARLRAAHLEQERARQKSVETERLVALGSLVAGVAHEVNNPLAGLKNCVRRLERDDLAPPKRREYLELMNEGLERIEDVVRRLLDFGRPHPTALVPVEARQLAEGGARLMQPLLHKRRISCAVVADAGGEGLVLADRRKVEQALMNLLLNAAYVTPDGGALRLRLRARDGLRGLAVQDDGPGIPPEIRDRVLDPFFSTKPEGEGTGLGLSVTRTIADAHGGELTFEFPDEGGTMATLWLRAAG